MVSHVVDVYLLLRKLDSGSLFTEAEAHEIALVSSRPEIVRDLERGAEAFHPDFLKWIREIYGDKSMMVLKEYFSIYDRNYTGNPFDRVRLAEHSLLREEIEASIRQIREDILCYN